MIMIICCFPYCAVLYFILIRIANVVNANDKEITFGTFKTKDSTRVRLTGNTTDVYSKSLIACAGMCLSDHQCCLASYSKGTSTCRLDSSGRCCIEAEPLEGWRLIQRNSFEPLTYKGCIHYGYSTYSIFEEHIGWFKAKENCVHLGGKLAELETSGENEHIKTAVRTRNTGVQGYWIGGYNFNNDNDMEWISKPNQDIPFSDMYPGQPNEPMTDLCMMIWRKFDFCWADYSCNYPIPYICEFQYT